MLKRILCAGIALSAVSAHAVPIISDKSLDGDNASLQCLFNGSAYAPSCAGATGWITSGPALDPNDEGVSRGVWTVGATGASISRLVIEIAGNAALNSFGIYSIYDPTITLEIFSGSQSNGALALIEYTLDGRFVKNFDYANAVDLGGNAFGFYLSGPGGTFYSQSSLNPNGDTQMLAFQGGQGRSVDFRGVGSSSPWLANEWLLAWEDIAYRNSDADFNDLVVLVESVTPVSEPGTLALLGAGLLVAARMRRLQRR